MTDQPPLQNEPIDPRPVARLFRAGWGTAAVWALATAVAAGAVAEGAVWLAATAGRSPASTGTIVRAGGILFFWFHGVGANVVHPGGGPRGPGAALLGMIGFSLSFSFMLGTLLVLVMLAMGGRRIAETTGGPAWLRALVGTKVALPYAMLCFLLALAERFVLPLPSGAAALGLGPGGVEVHPAPFAAFVWPLVLGVIGGFAGGLRSAPERETSRAGRLVRGAVSGGTSMLGFALGLSFLGLLILAALHPDTTRAYVGGMFDRGPFRGAALVAFNVLLAPNMSTWLLFPAMGSCVGGQLWYGGASYSTCLVSYGHVATPAALRGVEALGPFATNSSQLPAPAAGYLAFLAVPLAAALLGGFVAARRAEAESRAEAAGVGALAGVSFAVLAVVAGLLAGVVLQVYGAAIGGGPAGGATATLRIGPQIDVGALLALAWGVAGGVLGGLIAGRSRSRAPGEAWRPAGGPSNELR